MFLLALVVGCASVGWWGWGRIMGPATVFEEERRELLVPTGADLEMVIDSLKAIGALDDDKIFRWLCERKNYALRIRPGRYVIERGTGLNALVDRLRSGQQDPVRVTFTNIADLPELAGRLARTLEPDSAAFLNGLQDPVAQAEAGMAPTTFIALFIPNTYEFWWTTTPSQFIDRMRKEHDAFWTSDRRTKARELELSAVEVSTLASIVQAETVQMADAARIAGVYLNRLRIGMPLQADPTLKFALRLGHVQRVLDRDKDVASPYNTYKYAGLPPGPINMPEPRFIDAVLDAEPHAFLYFCARSDLSGFSDFSRTYEQHLVNARKYQRALNQRKIFR